MSASRSFRMNRCGGALALAAVLALPAVPLRADTVEEKAEICSACHGANGIPTDPKFPVIWGQYEGYLYIQLRDMKRGDRKNEQMQAILENYDREDLKAFAAYFAKKSWPNLAQPRANQADTLHSETVSSSAQCAQCHLGGFLGAGTTPRLAGQNHDYLLKTMQDFRSGERANNEWMTALLQKFSEEDLVAMAKYLAGL